MTLSLPVNGSICLLFESFKEFFFCSSSAARNELMCPGIGVLVMFAEMEMVDDPESSSLKKLF